VSLRSVYTYTKYDSRSASRQRLLGAAYNMSMLCVPEGGMNYDWDLTYIIDGQPFLIHSGDISFIHFF